MSEEPSLGKKTFFATLWTVGSRLAVRFIGVISLIILAKILGPEDYGLVGKATLIQGFLYLVTELGMEPALITKRDATKDHYDTAWTLHILRGVILALVLVAIAYPASIIMKEERLEIIIYCLAAFTFFSGFYNIYVVDFRKKMKFSYDFYFSLYSKVAGFVVTIYVAYQYQTYWALVFGSGAASFTKVVSSYLMTSNRPKISLVEFSSLFNFSKWVMMNEVIKAVLFKIDQFLLSIYSTTTNVGLYVISKEISSLPTSELAMPVGRACTPSFSLVNHDLAEFKHMYVSTLSVLLLVTIPAATGVSMLAEPIVHVALDEKWVNAIPVIQVLAIYGVFHATIPIYISASLARGRPDLLTIRSAISVVYTVIILFLALKFYGFMGLVWGSLLCGIISVFIAQIMMRNLEVLSFRLLFKNVWRCLIANALMIVSLYYIVQNNIIVLESMLMKLIVGIVSGASIYGLTLIILWMLCGRCDGPEKTILGLLPLEKIKNKLKLV